MPVGQDLPILTQGQMNHIFMDAEARLNRPLMTGKTWASLDRTCIGKELLEQFDQMYSNPRYARPHMIGILTTSAPLTEADYYTREYEGLDPNGNQLYSVFLSPECLVRLSQDKRVLAIDDCKAYYSNHREAALSKINKDRLCDELKTGNSKISDGIIFTASEALPELEAQVPYDAGLGFIKKDQDGHLTYRIYKPSLWNVAYLSNDPKVIEVMAFATHRARNSLDEQGLPEYTPSKQLVAAFADAAYPKGVMRAIDRILYATRGESFFEDQAVLDLQKIARKSFMPFIDRAFYNSTRATPRPIEDHEKQSLSWDIKKNLPGFHKDWARSYDLQEKFAARMADDLLGKLAERQTTLTTKPGTEMIQLIQGNSAVTVLRLKKP